MTFVIPTTTPTFGSCWWWSWCQWRWVHIGDDYDVMCRFVIVMIMRPATVGSYRWWLWRHGSVRNGDDHDATTVPLVLVMVSVATNLRVAAYWWWSSATSLTLSDFWRNKMVCNRLQCVVQLCYERAGNEFNIYVSRLSRPRIQPCLKCGPCNMRHSPDCTNATIGESSDRC